MLYHIVAVHDQKLEAFARPVFVASEGVAMRSFADEVRRQAENNEMNRHPEDFALYALGTFNDQDGSLNPLSAPRRLMTATQAKEV